MNPCFFIIMLSLFLLLLVTRSASQLAAVGGDDINLKKCLEKERDALLHFKSQIEDIYGSLSTWTADDDECCQWRGVTCNNQTGHIIELDIAGYGLAGELSHSQANLTYLNRLDLSSNSFHGAIPTFIGSMTRLSFIDLSSNSFNGTIPRSIGSLTELRYLDLADNSLYGTIPPEFGNLTNLQVLYLYDVGRCRVENPEWLSRRSHLEELDMRGISLSKANHWADAILSLRNLSFLSLQGCELSQVMSPYSSSFLNSSSSSSIERLYLGNNGLTSSMYAWLFPLASNKLYHLDLSNNMVDGVPKFLGNLCGLEYLSFFNNSAAVNLREFLTNLSGCTSLALQLLDVSYSQFTGPLSDEILKFSSLDSLYVTQNHLYGSISEKLLELPSLLTLDVSLNSLTVPSAFHFPGPSYLQY